MENNSFVFILSVLVLLTTVRDGNCLDIETVEEGPCIVPPVDLQLDFFWIANIPEFYYPIISKYALYKYAVTLSGMPIENISEEMAHNSCQVLNINTDAGATISAFGGTKKTNVDALITDQGVVDWVQKRSDGTLGYRGRTYTTLTDNNKYIVTVSCYETENQKSYEVVSREKTLDEASKKVIRDHLKSLGFDLEKTWMELKYDNCYDLTSNKFGGASRNYSVNNPPNNFGNSPGHDMRNISMVKLVNSDGDNSTFNSGSVVPNSTTNDNGNSSSNNTGVNSKKKLESSTNNPINAIQIPKKTTIHQNSATEQVGTVVYNIRNRSTIENILSEHAQRNNERISSATSNGQVPQNVIIIYTNDPSITNNPAPTTPAKISEYRNSADLFFDIFRTGIDFLQNAYKNGVRYLFLLAQRVIGRFNSFRQTITTSVPNTSV